MIRMQSRESRHPERGRCLRQGGDKVNRVGRKKCSSSVLLDRRPPAFHCRALRESGKGEEAGGAEGQPEATGSGDKAEGEDTKWVDGR